MEKILIVLVVLLVLALLVLIFVVKPKKKRGMDKSFVKESPVIDKPIIKDEPVIDKPIIKEEPVIDLSESIIESVSDDDYKEKTEVIEIIESMQEKAKDLTEKVADYEDEQEENAIISYTELLNAVKAKKSVQEELKFEEYSDPAQVSKPYNDEKKFHSSEAISPLGRINGASDDSYRSNRKPDNMENGEFLKSLKDFRENL